MTLLFEDFKALTDEWRSYYPNHDEIANSLGAEFVDYEVVDEVRWGNLVRYVYKRGEEYVSVTYLQGSGDSEYDYEPEINQVRPVQVTVTAYEIVKD